MNLLQLKKSVDTAIEYAKEVGENPEEIIVSIQIDNPDENNSQCCRDTDFIYDNDSQASGCVIYGIKE